MLIAKYNKKANCMFCPKCKKYEVSAEGEGTYKLPAGFGFLPDDHKFSVVGVILKGWVGHCEICRKEVFNWIRKRRFINYPKALNRELQRVAR